MAVINTPNMSLPVPVVGQENGPFYARDVNSCFSILDAHTHSAGSGVQITPDGLNINSTLPFGGNFATGLGGLTLVGSVTTAINTIYETTVGDLHYINASGLDIQITNSTGVAVTPTSIPGLVAPASVEYIPASSTFVWQSNIGIAANMDFGAAILRNLSPNSTFALTLQPPTLTSNYTITLPALPPTTSLMALDSSGNISAPFSISGGLNASVLTPGSITVTQMGANSVGSVQIINGSISGPQLVNNINMPGDTVQENGKNVIVSNTNAAASLALVRATIARTGGIVSGEGFTIARTGGASLGFPGRWTVTFTTPFADIPAMTGNSQNTGLPTDDIILWFVRVTAADADILVFDGQVGSSQDSPFSFVAIGQRT